MTRAEIAGQIGGMVSGFKRRERQKFLVSFIKLIEMSEYPDLRLTSSLAKKLITELSGCRSIKNDVLVKEFGRPGNKVKQKNLDSIVIDLAQRYRNTYREHWAIAKNKIDTDANEYKKLITTEITH